MADIEKTVKATTELVGVGAILGVNLATVRTIQDVIAQANKNGFTRRFPTPHKTTTPQGKKEYQRWYMRERNHIPRSKWTKIDFGKKQKW